MHFDIKRRVFLMRKRQVPLFVAVFLAALFLGTAVVSAEEVDPFYLEASQLVKDNWKDSFFGQVILKIGDPYLHIDGVAKEIDPGRDTAPAIVDGRTLLPIRALVETLGGAIEYEPEGRILTVTYGDQTVKMAIDSREVWVNGEKILTDVPPIIMNDRTMLPVRALAENLGLSVKWIAETQESVFTNDFQTMRILAKHDGSVNFSSLGATKRVSGPGNLEVLQFSTAEATAKALDLLSKTKGVLFAEPDTYIPPQIGTSSTAATSSSHLSWGASKLNVDAYADYLKNNGKLTPVLVAVLDTGVDASHPHLAGRIASGGYDFAFNDFDPKDGDGHGTHVSGTIVDLTPGLTNIKILPVKVMDDKGRGTFLTMANGLRYAADKSARVINMSLGGPAKYAESVKEAVQYAVSKNVAVVVSAGNDAIDANQMSPANISSAIVVAAFDSSDRPASFTNYGSTVDVGAPGVSIKSSTPGNNYASWDGTSMAAPHITALAAMYTANDPSLSPAAIESLLKKNSRIPSGYNQTKYGAGIPDMAKALSQQPDTPVATQAPTPVPTKAPVATPTKAPAATPTKAPAATATPAPGTSLLDPVKKIIIAKLPDNLKYIAGELLDTAGLRLGLTYESGKEETLDFTPSLFSLSLDKAPSGGKFSITVTHKESGESATFNIN
jgi:subtilisin family serine protease